MHPARELPEDKLRLFLEETKEIVRNPDMAGMGGTPNSEKDELRSDWIERSLELRAELRRRKTEGQIPDSASGSSFTSESSEDSDNNPTADNNATTNDSDNNSTTNDENNTTTDDSQNNPTANDDNNTTTNDSANNPTANEDISDTASSSSNTKKIFEASDESSTTSCKEGFKQDTSGILPDTEMPNYGWESED